MPEEKGPKPLLSGVIYGECVYWISIIGMLIGIIGMVLYFFGGKHFFDAETVISGLLSGKSATVIWQEAAGRESLHGHWYLHQLSYSDAIAMLGIGICCLSAVVGVWGAFLGMVIKKERPYFYWIFALILGILLILAAMGKISLHH